MQELFVVYKRIGPKIEKPDTLIGFKKEKSPIKIGFKTRPLWVFTLMNSSQVSPPLRAGVYIRFF